MSSNGDETRSQEIIIIRRAHGQDEGGHHGGVWKIAYADFMTAMMAFFLVMWLINSTDKQTLTQVATYFNPVRLTDKSPSSRGLHQEAGAQGKEMSPGGSKQEDGLTKGKGKAEGGKTKPEGNKSKADGGTPTFTEDALFSDPYAALSKLAAQAEADRRRSNTDAKTGGDGRLAGGEAYRDPFDPAFRRDAVVGRTVADPGSSPRAEPSPAPDGKPAEQTQQPPDAAAQAAAAQVAAEEAARRAEAARLEEQIKQTVTQSLPGTLPNIDVTVTEEGLLISLTDDLDFGMFAIASAEPRPAMVVVMERLAKVLAAHPERLIVRGHTDARPYKSGAYDNWRLSTARAHMAYYMLVRGGIDEKRFDKIEGFADRSLRVPREPEAAQNRRIEILMRKAKP